MFVPRKPRTYGHGLYGNVPEDKTRCICCIGRTFAGILGTEFGQCLRKRGHGPKKEFCRQHAEMIEKEKPHER